MLPLPFYVQNFLSLLGFAGLVKLGWGVGVRAGTEPHLVSATQRVFRLRRLGEKWKN